MAAVKAERTSFRSRDELAAQLEELKQNRFTPARQRAIDRAMRRLGETATHYDQEIGDPGGAGFEGLVAVTALAMLDAGYARGTVLNFLSNVGADVDDPAALGRRLVKSWKGHPIEKPLLPIPVSFVLRLCVELAAIRDDTNLPLPDRELAARALLAVTLIYAGGLRPGEVAPFRHGDLEWHHDRIVREFVEATKGDPHVEKGQWAVIRFPACPALDPIHPQLAYEALSELVDVADDGLLFPSHGSCGKQVSSVSKQLFATTGTQMSVSQCEAWTWGVLRRSRATHWMLEGVPTPEISRRLRHSRTSTTQHYLGRGQVVNDAATRAWMLDPASRPPHPIAQPEPDRAAKKLVWEPSWEDAVDRVQTIADPQTLTSMEASVLRTWEAFCEHVTHDPADMSATDIDIIVGAYLNEINYPNPPAVGTMRTRLWVLGKVTGLPPSIAAKVIRETIWPYAKSGNAPVPKRVLIPVGEWQTIVADLAAEADFALTRWAFIVLRRSHDINFGRIKQDRGEAALEALVRFLDTADDRAAAAHSGIPIGRLVLARQIATNPALHDPDRRDTATLWLTRPAKNSVRATTADGSNKSPKLLSPLRQLIHVLLGWLGPFENLQTKDDIPVASDLAFTLSGMALRDAKAARWDGDEVELLRATVERLVLVSGDPNITLTPFPETLKRNGLPTATGLFNSRAAFEWERLQVEHGVEAAFQQLGTLMRWAEPDRTARDFVARHGLRREWISPARPDYKAA